MADDGTSRRPSADGLPDLPIVDVLDVLRDALTEHRRSIVVAPPRIRACRRARLCATISVTEAAAVALTVEAMPPPAAAISS